MSCQDLPAPPDDAVPRLSHTFSAQQNFGVPVQHHVSPSPPDGAATAGLDRVPYQFTTGFVSSASGYMNTLPDNVKPVEITLPGHHNLTMPRLAMHTVSSHGSHQVRSDIVNQYQQHFMSPRIEGSIPFCGSSDHGNGSAVAKEVRDVAMRSDGVDERRAYVAGTVSDSAATTLPHMSRSNDTGGEENTANEFHSNQPSSSCHDDGKPDDRYKDDSRSNHDDDDDDDRSNASDKDSALLHDDEEDDIDGHHDDGEKHDDDSYHGDSEEDEEEEEDGNDSEETEYDDGNVTEKDVDESDDERAQEDARKVRQDLKDFIAPDDDDTEDGSDYNDSDNDAVGDDVNGVGAALSAEAMEHLTRLRARMSSKDGGRDDMNRYFEALISYDEGVPQEKPQANSDEEWTLTDAQSKKRNMKIKKNRKGSPKKAHKCQICARIFYQAKQLEKHIETHVKPKKFVIPPSKLPPDVKFPLPRNLTCETCGKVFKRTAHLNRHRMIHTGEKPHICDICGDRFSRPDKMRLHRKIHDKNRQFKCKVCGELFALNKLLKLHRKTHKTESKLYECDVCGKNFTVYARLHRHRMIHSGKKPYLCEICGDRFTQSTDLQRHRIIHTGIKAHLCHTCGKKFYHAAHLRRHVKIHERQKPYICQICGGQFARSDILKRHEKIHTGEKEYACEQCGKLFTRSSHLQRHMVTHSGKPAPVYKCTYCHLQFSSNDRLKQHVKLHHPTTFLERSLMSENQLQRDCRATPDQLPPEPSPCQRTGTNSAVMTPDQSRLNSPSARSQCSEPDIQYSKQFNFPSTSVNQQFFNHHLGLQAHQLFPHGANNARFDCMICGEHFPSGHMLEMHYTIHTNMDRHYMPEKTIDHGQFLPATHNRHMDLNVRHGEHYRCETCGERFTELTHFQIHCVMHTGDFGDNFTRQLAPFAAPHFQNPVFQDKSRSAKVDNFKPLLGPLSQAQNLSVNHQINPSCERSKVLSHNYTRPQSTSPDFPFSMGSMSQPPESYRHPAMMTTEPARPIVNPDLGPFSEQIHKPEANVTKKPVSIMNNLKQRKRPRLVEAVPNTDQSNETVGYTLDGQPVLNPDVNIGRNKSEQRKYKCGTCFQLFDTPQDRIEHVKIHIADMEKLNSCQVCEDKFSNEDELKLHVKHCHAEDEEEEVTKDEGLVDDVECYSPSASVTSSDAVPVSMVPSLNSITYQCIDCGLTFQTESALRRHGKTHQIQDPAPVVKTKDYACDVCFKTFLRPHHLTRHKLIHSGLKPFKCDHCEMAFSRSDKLKEHLSKIHGQTYSPPKKEIKCEKCEIVFGTKADLKDHDKAEHPKCIKCDICGKSFTKQDHLKRHRRTHSKSSSRNLLNICEYCNHEFRSEYELNEHVRHVHNDQQTFQCGFCQAKFVCDSDLQLHQSLIHQVVEEVDDVPPGEEMMTDVHEAVTTAVEMTESRDVDTPRDVQVVTCELCQLAFRTTALLERHKRREHKLMMNQKCKCETCGKEFNTEAQLRRHRKTHSGDKPYMCDECGDSFSRSSHLVRHKVRHTGRREFKCDQCSAEFSRSDHLLCHKRTHSGNKPYVCDICGLQFASGQGLKGHMTSHTGEKPYVCRHCGEKFSRNSHLIRHRAQEHNDGKTHDCELCGKSFTRRDQLKRHEKTHSGEKPHVCPTCGKAFARLPLLIRHEKQHEKQQQQQQQQDPHQSIEQQQSDHQQQQQPPPTQQHHQQQQQQQSQQHQHQSLQQLPHSSGQHQHLAQQQPGPPLGACLGQVGMGRLPISMMDCWSKWTDYHHPGGTGPPQFPFSGSLLQAAINVPHM